MKKTLLILVILASSLMFSFGEDVIDAKILKYIKIIRKNPGNTNLFKRFYRQWLSQNSMTELETFLKKQSSEMEAGGAELLLAHLYVVSHQNIKAQKALNESIKKNPHLSFSFHLKADLESLNADYKLAATNYLKAFELAKKESRKIKILKSLSKVYIRNREFKKAKEIFEKLQKVAGEDEALREEIMEIQIEESLYKQAVETCDRLIVKTKSKYKKVLFQLRKGDIYLMQHKKTKAVEVYVTCLDLVEAGGWVERQIISQIQKAYRSSNDLVGLIKQFKKVSLKYPKNINVQKQLALITLENGNEDEALAIFQKIIKLSPGDVALRDAFLSFLKKAGKTEEVLQQYKTMIAANPTDSSLILSYAIACHEDEKLEQSKSSLLKYLSVSKKTVGNYMRVTSLLERFDFDDTSLDVIAKGISLFPDNMELKEIQLNLLYNNKQGNKANGLLKELSKSADEGVFLRFIGLAEMNEGRKFALEIIEENKNRFKENFLFNQKYMQLLINLKKYKEAYPVSRQLLVVSKSASDHWQTCLKIYLIIHKEDRLNEITSKLKKDIKILNEKDTCLLILLLNKSGSFADETKFLKEALENNKKSILLLETKSRLAKLNGNTKEQLNALNAILMYYPEKKTLYLPKLIAIHLLLGNTEKVLKLISEWKQINKGSVTPYLKESEVYMSSYKVKKAIQAIREGLRKFDKNDTLRKKLAKLYHHDEKPSEARNLYWLMIDDSESLNGKIAIFKDLCNTMPDEDEYHGLLQELKARQAKNKNEPFPLLAQAFVYGYLNEYEERRNVLLKAAEINKDSIFILHMLAKIAKDDYRYHESEIFLNQADKIDQTKKTKQLKTKLYIEMGETEKANLIMDELLANQQLDEKFILDHTFQLMIDKKFDEAIKVLNKVLQKKTDSYRLLMLKAYGLEELKKNKEALEIYLSMFNFKNKPPKKKNSRYGQAQSPSPSLYPAQLLHFYQLRNYSYSAYNYRTLFEENGYYYSRITKYPTDVKMAKYFALSHITKFALDMKEKEKSEVKEFLKSHEVPYVDIFFALALERELMVKAFKKLEKIYKDDPIYYFLSEHMLDYTKPKLWLESIIEKFEKTYPNLIICAYRDVLQNRNNRRRRKKASKEEDYFDKFVEVMDKSKLSQERQTQIKMNMLSYQIGWRISKDSFSPQIEKIIKSVENQKKFLQPYQIKRIEHWHIYKLFFDKKIEAAITSLNKFSKIVPVDSSALSGQYRWNSSSSFSKLSFSDDLINGDDFIKRVFIRSDFLKLKKENLKPFVKNIKHEALRFWLMTYCKFDKKEIKEFALKLIKSSHIDSILLGATWLHENEWDKMKVLQTFDKTRHLPMSRSKRKVIDSAILFMAADYLKEEPMQKFIKPVVKRFLRYHLNKEEENALVYYFEALGMADEIDRFDKKQAIASKKINNNRHASSGNVALNKIRKLLKSEKKQKAVDSLIKQYRKDTIKVFSLTPKELNVYIEAAIEGERTHPENALSLIVEYSLEKEVLTGLALQDKEKSRHSLLVSARAQEEFGDKKKAKAIYEELVKTDSNDYISIVRLHLFEKASSKIAFSFGQVSVEKLELLVCFYLYSIDFFPENRGVLFERIDQLINALEDKSLKMEPELSDTIAGYLYTMIYQARGSDYEEFLPNLFSDIKLKKFLKLTGLKAEDVEPLIKKRDELFFRLCEIRITKPKSILNAASVLLSYYEARKIDSKPLFTKVLSCLKQKEFIKPILEGASYPSFSDYEYDEGKNIIGYLFKYAYSKQQENLLKECLKKVYELNPECPLIRNYEKIYDLPVEGFIEALDKIVLISLDKDEPLDEVIKESLAISTICDRKLKVDYYERFINRISKGKLEDHFDEIRSFVYTPLILKKDKEQIKFMREFHKIVFEKHQKALSADFGKWDEELQANSIFLVEVIQMILKSGPVMEIYKYYHEYEYLKKISDGGYIGFFNNEDNFQNMTLDQLKKTHMLDELKTFDFYGNFMDIEATKESPKKSEVISTIVQKIIYGSRYYYGDDSIKRMRTVFLKYYKKKTIKTFGDKIFYFSYKDKNKELLKLFNNHFDEISQKDEKWLKAFFKFFEERTLPLIEGFKDSKIIELYRKRTLPNLKKKIDIFLKPGYESDRYSLVSYATALVEECLLNDMLEKALEVSKRCDELMKRMDMKTYRHYNGFISDSYRSVAVNNPRLFVSYSIRLLKQARSSSGINSIGWLIGNHISYPKEDAELEKLTVEGDEDTKKDKEDTPKEPTIAELQIKGKKYFKNYVEEFLDPLVEATGDHFYLPLQRVHYTVLGQLKYFKSTDLVKAWLKGQSKLTPQLKELQLILEIVCSKEKEVKPFEKALSEFYFGILKSNKNEYLRFSLVSKLLTDVELKTKDKALEEYLLEELYQFWLKNKAYDESYFSKLVTFWTVEDRCGKDNKTWKKIIEKLEKNFFKHKWSSPIDDDELSMDFDVYNGDVEGGREYFSIVHRLKIFELSNKHGQDGFYKNFLLSERFRVWKSSIFLPLLVKYNEGELFTNLFIKHHKVLNIDLFSDPDECFKGLKVPDFEVKAEAMIKTIADPELQFYSRVVMSRFATSMGTPSTGAYLNRKTLISAMNTVEFKNKKIKKNCLVSLASEELISHPKFEKDYENLLKKYSFSFLSGKDEGLKKPLTLLAAKPFLALLKAGKIKEFDALVTKKIGNRNNYRYSFYEVFFRLLSIGFKGYPHFSKDAKLIFKKLNSNFSYSEEDVGFHLLLISGMLAGQEEIIKKYNVYPDEEEEEEEEEESDDDLVGVEEEETLYTEGYFYSISPGSLLKTVIELADIANEAEKKLLKDVYIKMIRSEIIIKYMKPTKEVAKLLKELKKLYTDEEIKEIESLIKLIKDDPDKKKEEE